jgi:hypothetical protein
VLKDPTAPYAFGRTAYMQKVKLAGPDINAGVVGVGFSLSANPRRWGLLTAVGEPEQLRYYCRTEVLVGDALHRAFGIVFGLKSRVRVTDVLDAAGHANGLVVHATASSADVYRVRCKTKPDEDDAALMLICLDWYKGRVHEGRVELPKAALAGATDAQWLCSPWECPFTLSLHGDLRPLGGMEPRHPRGRVEFYAPETLPVWDTLAQIRAKFDEAAALDRFCIERSVLQRIQRLRALPAKRDTVREVRRIVQAWMRHYDTTPPLEWPQVPPSYEVTNAGLNAEWVNARDLLLRKLPSTMRPLVESALRPLQVEEGEALFNLPPHSQWAAWDRRLKTQHHQKQAEEAALPSQLAVEQNAHAAQLRTQLLERLKTLKVAMGKGLIRWPSHTHGNARVTLIEEEEEDAPRASSA